MLLHMKLLRRALAGLAIAVVGMLAAAGAYTEFTRIPGQP